MKMASGGLGIGLGVKDFRGIFVFTSRDALEQFVNSGWDASAQADAAAKAGDKGAAWAGAVDVAPGVKLYQITEHGLALQATIQGTKYWKADDLNSYVWDIAVSDAWPLHRYATDQRGRCDRIDGLAGRQFLIGGERSAPGLKHVKDIARSVSPYPTLL